MGKSPGEEPGTDRVRRTSRRIRKEIDEPGLRASIAADVNAVISTGGSASSRQEVHVRQGRSARTGPSSEEKDTT